MLVATVPVSSEALVRLATFAASDVQYKVDYLWIMSVYNSLVGASKENSVCYCKI